MCNGRWHKCVMFTDTPFLSLFAISLQSGGEKIVGSPLRAELGSET